MKSFDKAVLITGVISLVLAMIFGFITLFCGAKDAVKVISTEGVKTAKQFYEYGNNKFQEFKKDGKLVFHGDGEEIVVVDLNE